MNRISLGAGARCSGLRAALLPALFAGSAAARANGDDCGTVLTPEDVEVHLANQQAGLYEAPPIRGAGWWYVPISMHVVRRTNGSGGLPESRLATALSDLNGAFAAQGVVFYRSGPTRYIDSDAFYFNIDTSVEIDALRQSDVVAGAVNVYFTENLADEFGDLCGISSFTTSVVQGIVMRNACTAVSGNHSTFPHEFGHYFDLYHTHETAFGTEHVIRTNCQPLPCPCYVNCSEAGDLLCDTPADPGLSESNVNSNCVYTGTERDPCEDRLYTPHARNFMSYSRAACRDAFTVQQNERALATLQSLRTELNTVSDGCGEAVFVNGDFPGGGTGTPFLPYATIAEGIQAAADFGCVLISAGDYAGAPLVLNRPMTLHAPLGAVRIGNE